MNTNHGLPAEVHNVITQVVPDAEITVAAVSDLGPDGRFGEQWIALAGDRILVCEPNGDHMPKVTVNLPVKEISDIQVESLVGGSMLQAVVDGRPIDLVPFTNALSKRFGRVRGQLDAVVKEKPVPDIPIDEHRCAKCGLLLGENTRVCPRCVHRSATLRRLLQYTHPYRGKLLTITLLMLVSTAFGLVPPYLTKVLVDDVLIPKKGAHLLLLLIVGLTLSSVLSTAFSIWRGRLGAWMGARISFDIRAQLYERLQWLSMRYFDRHPTGTIISRLTQDSGGVQDFLAFGLPMIATNILTVLGVSIAVFVINWKLAILAILPAPVASFACRFLWSRMRHAFHKFWQRWGRFYGVVNDALSRVKVIKAFSQQPMEIAKFQDRNSALFGASIHAEQMFATVLPMIWFLFGAGSIFVWYFGGLAILKPGSTFSIGELMAYLAYLGMLYGPLNNITMSAQWMTRALTAAERIFEVIDAESDSEKSRGTVIPKEIRGEVVFRNVVFGYEKHQQTLKDVSFKVEPGQMLGLVGKSGAGKTTIINLLCRFYELDEGDILIDGVSLRDLDLSAYRGRLGAVLQEPFLFGGTVAENIAYGKPDASIEEIMAAAKVANAHDFIMNKPDGYDEQVGECGARLSAGEKQRICIARAILHDPAILILDEATANVDLETESQIQEAIARLIENRTTFAIAHRLSTLRNAHNLLVIEDGKIAEFGNHDQLAEKPEGVYRRLLDIHQKTSLVKAIER